MQPHRRHTKRGVDFQSKASRGCGDPNLTMSDFIYTANGEYDSGIAMSMNVESAYRDHGDIVYRRARMLVGEEEAMDVVQELFVSLLHRPEQFKGSSKLSTFLYSATTHACWNRLRNRRNRHRIHDEHIRPSLQEGTSATGEIRAIISEVIGQVDAQLAEVAVNYYVDEMSHQEIADNLGCSRRHVGNLLTRFHEQVERFRRTS